MNPITVVLSGLLLASAVAAGSSNGMRRRNQYASGSSEEYDRYSGPRYNPQQQQQQGRNFNQASYKFGAVPQTFDAREFWAQCPSVGDVPDQGCCDASYALVPTAVMTDRTCIATNNDTMVYSAFDVISCCPDCPIYQVDKCRGGEPVNVWKYWTKTGITNEDCSPYSFATTCIGQDCQARCAPGAAGTVAGNKKKGLEYYTVTANVLQIQSEIIQNGPVEASFDMYLDFATFTGTGVYIHRSSGPYLSKHSVKIIGWGTHEGTPYWLVVNTFGQNWGDNGVAKFLRGQNHLNIETNVRAAKPNF